MAEAKKNTGGKKIIDVSHPDKTPPSETSKPVIVKNRPIMQDPMMALPGSAESESPAESKVKVSRETVIKPLSAPDLPADSKSEDKEEGPKKSDRSEEKVDDKKTIAQLAEEAKSKEDQKKNDEKNDKPEADKSKEDTGPDLSIANLTKKIETDDDEKAGADKPGLPAATDNRDEDKPEEEKSVDEDEAADAGEKKATTDPVRDDEKAEADASKEDEKINKLIESKKYYLPINTVEKRRSKRVVILGLFLSVLLGLAWVNIALDAGLIEIPGIDPVTSFFSN